MQQAGHASQLTTGRMHPRRCAGGPALTDLLGAKHQGDGAALAESCSQLLASCVVDHGDPHGQAAALLRGLLGPDLVHVTRLCGAGNDAAGAGRLQREGRGCYLQAAACGLWLRQA